MFGSELTIGGIIILALGFVGQALFFMRFLVQRLPSKKHARENLINPFSGHQNGEEPLDG